MVATRHSRRKGASAKPIGRVERPKMIFEVHENQLVPLLLYGFGGSPLVIDGHTLLTLEQAAAKTGRAIDTLKGMWLATCARLIEPDEPSEMVFHVGPWSVRVEISNGKLYDDCDQEAAGLYSWSDRTIYISGVIPVGNRLDTLFHELRHAWRYTFGTVIGDEDDANNASAFAAMCHRELLRNGGEAALEALQPVGKAVSL